MIGNGGPFSLISAVFDALYPTLAMTAFVWAPIVFGILAKHYWLHWKESEFFKSLDHILLEIKLPREIAKSPMAMELVLQSMYQTSAGTWYDHWWKGKVRAWFSLELISDEGNVRFLIWTPKKFRKLIESHLYAQYPGIEVTETEDYVTKAPYLHQPGAWSMFGAEYALTQPDPYPIKTYIDYGLDKDAVDEEQKSDPLSSTIEFLGSFGPNQYVWLQIMIMPVKDRFPVPGAWFEKQGWKAEAKKVISELKKKLEGDGEVKNKLSKREMDMIHAIQNSMSKIAFDVGIRCIHIGKKENYDGALNAGIAGLMRVFSSQDLNGFKPVNTTDFDFPWQDWHDKRLNKKKKDMYNAYIRRSYFYHPYHRRPYVLNSEELATIWHFPGMVSETPTFTRIESKKSEPPANLPV